MPPSDTAEIVRRFVHEVLNAGDAAAVEALVAPGYIVHSPLEGLTDRPSLLSWLSSFRSSFPDAQWAIEDMICQDDRVCVRLLFSGTQSGEFLGRPATGKAVQITEIHMCRLADGLLLEHWPGTDNLQLLLKLDLL